MHSLACVLAVAALAGGAEPLVLREGVAVEPETAFILEGWIQVSSGEARLEVEVAGAGGRIAGRSSTPPVPAGSGWAYTAAETDPLPAGSPASARILLAASGEARARDVQLVPLSPRIVANGGFELPADAKGRIPFWSEEKDGSFLPGKREGSQRLDASTAREGKASLVVSAAGDWHAAASV